MVEESRSTTTSPSRLSSGGSLRQTTSEQFRIIWDADDADTSHASEAKIRIMKEYEKMQEMNLTVTHGISMELTHSDNPFLWRVLLRNFQIVVHQISPFFRVFQPSLTFKVHQSF